MCGRARCSLSREEIRAAAKVSVWQNEDDYNPSFNVAPGKSLPVLKQGPVPELSTMKWGLVPSYTKAEEKPDFFRMFNARSETVASKGVFKRLLKSQRCIIFTNGFYEWKQEGLQKQPYFVHLKGQEVMRMAGLYDFWKGPSDLKMLSATILTTDSSERLRWLHDRMPVILPTDKAAQTWLEGDESAAAEAMSSLCIPYNGEDLQWYAVDTKMSNMKEDGAECCKPLKRKAISTFFKPKSGSKTTAKTAEEGAVKREPDSQEAAELGRQEVGLQDVEKQSADSLRAPDGAALAEQDIKDAAAEKVQGAEIKEEDQIGIATVIKSEESLASTPKNVKGPARSPASVKRKSAKQSPGNKSKQQKLNTAEKGRITAFFAKNSA